MLEPAKKQIWTLLSASLIFGACTFLIVFFTDPFKTSVLVLTLFYVCFGITCLCFFTAVLYSLHRGRDELLHYQKMRMALRQAFLLALFVLGSLVLSSRQLLYWWVEAIFFITLVLIEMAFLV